MKQPVLRSERGYSLPEMLVVLAIISMISLVTVPQFISFQHANRLKTSMRQFANDLRMARQLAVSRHVRTKVGIPDPTVAANQPVRRYTLSQWNAATSSWQRIDVQGRVNGTAERSLEEKTFISATTNVTDTDTTNDLDIVFRPDGTLLLPAGVTSSQVSVRTDWRVAKQQYDLTISMAGFVKAQ
jgi:prepilin-type N-terminal cleavage/methylation domain-containing protein